MSALKSSTRWILEESLLRAYAGDDGAGTVGKPCWQYQGFGMLRLYLSKETRLHVWMPSMAVPNVSEMHTHPWAFRSTIVAGKLINKLYADVPGKTQRIFKAATLRCGIGGGLLKAEKSVTEELAHLSLISANGFKEGDSYTQESWQIHVSMPAEGTVTIVERTFLPDTEHARVYWTGGDGVSAEPRLATDEEVIKALRYSLQTWFSP